MSDAAGQCVHMQSFSSYEELLRVLPAILLQSAKHSPVEWGYIPPESLKYNVNGATGYIGFKWEGK